jgi:hypothetical protein
MYIGYAYMGGMANWNTSAGLFSSHSPVKLTNSKAFWTLGADTNMKVGNLWSAKVPGSAAYQFEYGSIPPHPVNGGSAAGGNEVFTDGSAKWCKFDTMYRFNNYASAIGSLDTYWYQEPSDFETSLLNALPALK